MILKKIPDYLRNLPDFGGTLSSPLGESYTHVLHVEGHTLVPSGERYTPVLPGAGFPPVPHALLANPHKIKLFFNF